MTTTAETADREALCAEGAMTVGEGCQFLGISRSGIYALMRQRKLPWVAGFDGRRRIPRAAARRLLAQHLEGAQTSGD